MSTGLAPGVAPGALVPGDPAGPRALAQRLDAYADSAATAAAQLRSLDAGDWVGEAAEAFRQTLGEMPQQLERAVGAFAEAASALRGYASVLAEAQQRAGLAQARAERAEAETAVWRRRWTVREAERAAEAAGGPPAGPAPPTHDPGAAGRASAEALLEAARAEVEAAARAAAARLERAAAEAPDEPGFWASAWHAAGQFLAGAAEATVELATFAFKLTPTYALVDPEGYLEHVTGLAEGLAYGVTHPVEFAKAVTNWELWLDNPARALGQLVPDLVVAVGTAGAGAAAVRGAKAARQAEKLSDVADGARAAERAAGAGRTAKGLNPATDARRLTDSDSDRSVRSSKPDAHVIDEAILALPMGRNPGVRVVSSKKDLDELFSRLSRGGSLIETSPYPGRFFQLPDGTTVGLRSVSRSGGPTIDIKMPNRRTVKVHVDS